MSNNKQSSIEWLEQELKKIPFVNVLEVFEQAKTMHKEQEYETKAYWFGRGVLAGREDRITELHIILTPSLSSFLEYLS